MRRILFLQKKMALINGKKTTDEFIDRCREVWGDAYDLSRVVYNGNKEKTIVICHKTNEFGNEHGDFLITPDNFLHKHGCPKCAKKFMDNAYFIRKCKSMFGNRYDFTNTRYVDSKTKVQVHCNIHDYDFYILPGNLLKNDRVGCSKCSKKYRYSTEEIIEKIKEIHGDKYDCSKVVYKSMYTPITLNCKEHGEFSINPVSIIHKKAGCVKCGYDEMKLKQRVPIHSLLEQFHEAHGDRYDYTNVEKTYKNARTPVEIKCKYHDFIFYQSPDVHKRGVGCPKCNESHLEKEVGSLLGESRINYTFQSVFKTSRLLRLDYLLNDYNIAIECQGEQHFIPIDFAGKGNEWANANLNANKERDLLKYNKCIEANIDVIYYTTKELYDLYCKDGYLGKVFYGKQDLLDYINGKKKENDKHLL